MSAFALKIIAMVTMFIDHLFASCIDPYGVDVWNISRHIVPGTGTTLYWIASSNAVTALGIPGL